jgi:hypothetical protein
MPRYFFTVTYADQEIDDTEGTLLSSYNAAVAAARTIIGDLLEDCDPGQARPLIMVRNEAGETIYQFPSN